MRVVFGGWVPGPLPPEVCLSLTDSTGRKEGHRERERERERDYADCVLMRVVFGGWVPGPLPSEV